MSKLIDKFTDVITNIKEESHVDGRCKHGMLPMQCGPCKGLYVSTKDTGISGGRVWFRTFGHGRQYNDNCQIYPNGFYEE